MRVKDAATAKAQSSDAYKDLRNLHGAIYDHEKKPMGVF
jgi:hypothetical protein